MSLPELVLLGVGLVFAIEGLVLALAPARINQLVELIRQMPVETRRLLGLTGVAIGVLLIWLARHLPG